MRTLDLGDKAAMAVDIMRKEGWELVGYLFHRSGDHVAIDRFGGMYGVIPHSAHSDFGQQVARAETLVKEVEDERARLAQICDDLTELRGRLKKNLRYSRFAGIVMTLAALIYLGLTMHAAGVHL